MLAGLLIFGAVAIFFAMDKLPEKYSKPLGIILAIAVVLYFIIASPN